MSRGAAPRSTLGACASRLPLTYRIGDRRIEGETLHLDAGASVLVLTSCSARLGIELRSAYLGAERVGELLVAESGVVGGEPAELGARPLRGSGELSEQRVALLYDHLQALKDLALRAGVELAFEGVDAAAALLDPRCSV